MAAVRRVVLDVLKPHNPPVVEFTERIADLDGVDGATCSLIELDQEVQNVQVTVEGADLDFPAVDGAVEDLGGSVHSVDQVACGDYAVADRPTLQDG